MCGITAIILKNGERVCEKELLLASDFIAHRGPDDSGIYLNKNVGLAHRRLAILDLTDKGKQPFRYQHLTIVFNGEIYNYIELKKKLKKEGFPFQTETDTEVILAAYLFWGSSCVQQFNGIWAFVIHDPNNKTIFCSRDRFGVKPLYFSTLNNKFCIVSEVKQLTVIGGWQAKLNLSSCCDWLQKGLKNHTNETFFEGVYQLPAGSNLTYDLASHQYSIQTYYDIAQIVHANAERPMQFNIAIEQFRDLFGDAVKLQMRADAKIGISLSGGLDSSSIAMATHSDHPMGKLSSFSYVPNERAYSEKKYIEMVANKTGQPNISVSPSYDTMMGELETVTWHQEEPLSAINVVANYFVFKKAKENEVKVILNGQGADEILGGYDACFKPFWGSLLRSNPLYLLKELIGFAYHQNLQNLGIVSIISNSCFPKKSNQCLSKSLVSAADDKAIPPVQNLTAYQLQLLQKTLLPMLLHYEDRNGMAHSIESRVPFLDHRLVEFCLTLPDHFKINWGRRKWLLREAMKGQLPKPIYRRYDKMAFATPQKKWSEKINADLSKVNFERMADMGIINLNCVAGGPWTIYNHPYSWKMIALNKFIHCYFS